MLVRRNIWNLMFCIERNLRWNRLIRSQELLPGRTCFASCYGSSVVTWMLKMGHSRPLFICFRLFNSALSK